MAQLIFAFGILLSITFIALVISLATGADSGISGGLATAFVVILLWAGGRVFKQWLDDKPRSR